MKETIIISLLIYYAVTLVIHYILLRLTHFTDHSNAQWWIILYMILSFFTLYHTISLLILMRVNNKVEEERIDNDYQHTIDYIREEFDIEFMTEDDLQDFLQYVVEHKEEFESIEDAIEQCKNREIISKQLNGKYIFDENHKK